MLTSRLGIAALAAAVSIGGIGLQQLRVSRLKAKLADLEQSYQDGYREAQAAARAAQMAVDKVTIDMLTQESRQLQAALRDEAAQKEREKSAKWAARRQLDSLRKNPEAVDWLDRVPPAAVQPWLHGAAPAPANRSNSGARISDTGDTG